MYTIDTKGKINKDVTISMLSDFHFNENTKTRSIIKLLDKIEKEQPNYIFLLGDIINDGKNVNNIFRNVSFYLNLMGTIAPVYMVYGNHDLMIRDNNGWDEYINDDYVSMLNSVENLKVLDNESVLLDENIGLVGIRLPFSYYQTYSEDSNKCLEIMNDKVNNHLLDGIDNESYNIFLTHTPNNFFDKKIYLEILKMIRENIGKDINFDLLLAGHLHNGLIPVYLDKIIPGNRGLVGAIGRKYKLFINNCRGITKISDNTTGIILPAVNTLVQYPFLNNLYPASGKTLVLKSVDKFLKKN